MAVLYGCWLLGGCASETQTYADEGGSFVDPPADHTWCTPASACPGYTSDHVLERIFVMRFQEALDAGADTDDVDALARIPLRAFPPCRAVDGPLPRHQVHVTWSPQAVHATLYDEGPIVGGSAAEHKACIEAALAEETVTPTAETWFRYTVDVVSPDEADDQAAGHDDAPDG